MVVQRKSVSKFRDRLLRAQGSLQSLTSQFEECKEKLKQAELVEENTLKARKFIQQVAQETQSNLEVRISSMVTKALSLVFEDTYEFKASFVQRNNRTVCDLLFTKGGEEYSPLDSAGGGVLDVASFALRVAYWSMSPNRPILVLDEAFKYVSVDRQEHVSALMKALSDKLGIQIILVSHLPKIISNADNVINIEEAKIKLKKKLPRKKK